MSHVIRYIAVLCLGLVLGLSVSLSGKENTKPPESEFDYPLLMDVMDTIETYYFKKVSREDLIQGAIEGMFEKLDPHSGLLSAQELSNLHDSNRGKYFGFGFEIAVESNQIRIVAPFASSPAERAGVAAGDVIESINHKLVEDMHLNDVLDEIRHHSINNLPLLLTLKHLQGQSYSITLRPENIEVASVKGQWLDGDIGYIRLSGFQENSTEEIIALVGQWPSPPKGVILDLRNNPGGLLDQAIQIADLFLSKGRIVSTSGRFFDANTAYFASPEALLPDVPILVLINKGSASASEVLAAALRENNRAVLMGETSFGKGSVQSIIPSLHKESPIKLTIAHYNTPNGNDIDAKGIEPDLKIAQNSAINTIGDKPIIPRPGDQLDTDTQLTSAIDWIEQQK